MSQIFVGRLQSQYLVKETVANNSVWYSACKKLISSTILLISRNIVIMYAFKNVFLQMLLLYGNIVEVKLLGDLFTKTL